MDEKEDKIFDRWYLLFLVFLSLKLAHIIDWNWWVVSMPVWLYIALYALGEYYDEHS